VTLHDHLRPVLCFAGLSVFGAAGFYASFVYLVSWLQTADLIPASRALEINSFSMAMLLPTVIVAGLLSDRFGRKPLLLLSTLLGLVGALPLFWLLNHPSIALAQVGQLGFVLIIGIYLGTLPAVVVEAAPPHYDAQSCRWLQYLLRGDWRFDATCGDLAGYAYW